jgi:hypothetical protein
VVPRSRARAPRARGSPPRRPRGGPPRGPPAVLKIYPNNFRPYFGAWGACACMARPQNLVPVGLATFENGGVGCAGAGCWTRHTFPRLFPVSGRKLFPPQHGWAPRNPRGRAVARTVRAPASGASALPPSHVLALCGWSARVGRVPVLCSGRCRVPKFSSRMRLLPPMRACRAAPGTVTAWTCPRATPSTGHIGRHGQLGEVPVARVSVSRMSPT